MSGSATCHRQTGALAKSWLQSCSQMELCRDPVLPGIIIFPEQLQGLQLANPSFLLLSGLIWCSPQYTVQVLQLCLQAVFVWRLRASVDILSFLPSSM